MQKFHVQMTLEKVGEARAKWITAKREFDGDVDRLMARLLHEAARHRMSAKEVAQLSGFSLITVRAKMRQRGLDPRASKRLLSETAAKTLDHNAELLGVDPSQMDLMSPLAYLPMGRELRKFLETEAVSQVTELAEDDAAWERWSAANPEPMGERSAFEAGFRMGRA